MKFGASLNTVTVVLNLVSIAAYVTLSIRLWRRQKKLEVVAYEEAFNEVKKFLPAIAFCVTLRDDPRVPDNVRNAAKSVIPDSVDITVVPVAAPNDRVH